jgi:hypothetical protein
LGISRFRAPGHAARLGAPVTLLARGDLASRSQAAAHGSSIVASQPVSVHAPQVQTADLVPGAGAIGGAGRR